MKWLHTEEWTAANFCRPRMRRKHSVARSRLRNGWCEVVALLLSQRPTTCFSTGPISLAVAPQDLSPSVTISLTRPCGFINVLRDFRAAF